MLWVYDETYAYSVYNELLCITKCYTRSLMNNEQFSTGYNEPCGV